MDIFKTYGIYRLPSIKQTHEIHQITLDEGLDIVLVKIKKKPFQNERCYNKQIYKNSHPVTKCGLSSNEI